MKDKTLTFLLLFSTILITLLFGVIHYQDKKYKQLVENIDTVAIIKRDTLYKTRTVRDTVPKYVTKAVTKRDTLYADNDTIPHIIELKHKTFHNKITDKNDTITYQAHVSGYDVDSTDYPRLDSINVSLKHQIIETNTLTNQVIKVQQRRNKWHLSPSVGLGYGLTNKKCDVFIGISLGYDIFN